MSASELTKRALAQSLKDLMHHAPFAKISVDDICTHTGINRRSFYNHFKDKYELLNWIYFKDFCEPLQQSQPEHAIDMFPEVCAHLAGDRLFYVRAFDVTGQNSFRDFCAERLYPYLERDYAQGCLNETAAQFILRRIMDAVFDRLQYWLKNEPERSPEEFSAYVLQTIRDFAAHFAQTSESAEEPKT